MKNKLAILLCAFALISFRPSTNGLDDLPKSVKDAYAFIPAGKLYVGKDVNDVGEFYIYKTEIDNKTYREFLSGLKKNGKTADLTIAALDTSKWRGAPVSNEPYAHQYHLQAKYNDFPVVNMSYEGALLFCKWLTDSYNQSYGANYIYEVRLPTRYEWMRAAQLDRKKAAYTWEEPFLKTKDCQNRCNYKATGDERIHNNTVVKDNVPAEEWGYPKVDITVPVTSFLPNVSGLYNMNGNVAELVSEKGMAAGGSWNSNGYDVRNESINSYAGPSSIIGFRVVLISKKK